MTIWDRMDLVLTKSPILFFPSGNKECAIVVSSRNGLNIEGVPSDVNYVLKSLEAET